MRARGLQMALALAAALAMVSWGLAAEPEKAAAKPKRAGGEKPAAARYDVLYEVYVPTFANLIVEKIREASERDFSQKKPGESDEDFALRKQVGESMLASITQAIKEAERFTVGWRLDRKETRTYLDVRVTALKDTALAGRFAQLPQLKTSFAGFQVSGAALTAHWVGQAPADEAANAAKLVDVLRDKQIKKIEAQGKPDDQKAIEKDLANKLFDVLRDTAASGRSDGGLSVSLNPKAATLVAGGYVADAAKLENVAKTVGGYLKEHHPAFASLKLDAEKSDGVTFHTLDVAAPQGGDREKFIQVFGESLEVVIGFGKEAVYVAAGKDAMKSLKAAIRKSAAPVVSATPFEISVALKPVTDFIAEVGKDEHRGPAQMAANLLEQSAGKDHVRLVVRPIERGVILRFDVEEGIVKLIGAVNPQAKEFLEGK